jgi:hypothetical protein
MNKKITFFSFIASFALLPLLFVQAQLAPEVYVRDLKLDKSTFQSEEAVTGSFMLINEGPDTISSEYYDVLLIGGFGKGSIPTKQYDEKMMGPVTLSGHESKKINFTYKLPAGISGTDLAIRVQATTKTSIRSGWADARIVIAGELRFLDVVSATLLVDGKTFSLESGPTVTNEKTLAVQVSLQNKTNTDVMLTPKISIYERSFIGAPVKTITEATTSLKSKEKKTVTVNLPVSELKPSVYAGKLDFVTDSGEKRAPSTTFRYIVGGDIATIQNISSDKTTAAKGDVINMAIIYSGAPYDIVTNAVRDIGTTTLKISLTNEKNETIGSAETQIDVNKGNKVSLPITTTGAGQGLSVHAEIIKGDKKITSYDAVLSKAPAAVAQPEKKNSMVGIWIGLGAILVILIIGLMLARRFKNRAVVGPMIMFLVIAGAMFVTSHKAEAFTVTDHVHKLGTAVEQHDPDASINYGGFFPTVFINSPSGTLAAGSAIYR